MQEQVIYLMSGNAHMPYLVVSLRTLRQQWQDSIVVYAYPESHKLLQRVASDGDLAIEPRGWDPPYRGKNGQFINKILLMRCLENKVSLYLDADTSIHGDVGQIIEGAKSFGFAATQWNDWVTVGNQISGRIRRLQSFPEINQRLVGEILSNSYPSVNGGVFASKSNSLVLPLWYKWTMEARRIFIADETVLHVMMPRFLPTSDMTVLRGGRFNCSPKYQPKSVKDEEIVIYHYHGDSCCRPKKSQRGYDLWMPMYQQCLKDNTGGIAEWIGSIKNRHLEKVDPQVGREKA